MGVLNREQILAADDLKKRTVPVPEWGGDVIVRAVTAAERDEYVRAVVDVRDGKRDSKESLTAWLVALACVDEQGNRLFTEDDVAALARKSAVAVTRVYEAASALNALSEAEQEELGKP